MRILLLGEYSNVHATLAVGLRHLGHEVTVVSNGDFWKNYPRDIDVSRKPGKMGGIELMLKIVRLLPKMTGYDIVQLINPMFFELKAERLLPIYKFLRHHNKAIVLGAFGMDYYWVHENITRMPLRYSDFNIGKRLRTDDMAMSYRKDWIETTKEKLNQLIANDCDGIVTGLYEYQAVYQPLFPDKTTFIPFPIICNHKFHPMEQREPSSLLEWPSRDRGRRSQTSNLKPQTIKLFIGISKGRSEYKGTDIMLKAAQRVRDKYPDRLKLRIAEGLPFKQYVELMQGSDVILDQLYSYTPAMNALEAMSHGIIVIGGGEPENYEILHETDLHPIINVEPCLDSVSQAIENLVLHPERLSELKQESIMYVQKHHDYLKVAREYEAFYKKI